MNKNIVKSKMAWLGLGISTVAYLWPHLQPILAAYVAPETLVMISGMGVIVLRYLTTTGVVILPAE